MENYQTLLDINFVDERKIKKYTFRLFNEKKTRLKSKTFLTMAILKQKIIKEKNEVHSL